MNNCIVGSRIDIGANVGSYTFLSGINHNINLVILGDGRDKSRIQEQINEKGLSDKFYF